MSGSETPAFHGALSLSRWRGESLLMNLVVALDADRASNSGTVVLRLSGLFVNIFRS